MSGRTANARTQVAIVGAGPAGLMLAHLLHRAGIESIVVEHRSHAFVQQRVRAGVLEQATVDLMRAAGLGERLDREGVVHRGVELRFGGRSHRVALSDLTGGRTVTMYAQQDLMKDLSAARASTGGATYYDVDDVAVHGATTTKPRVGFTTEDGVRVDLACDIVAGCDGFNGVCRDTIPAKALRVFERVFPFAWLSVLAAVAPSCDELIYAHHDHGFAMHSLQTPAISRFNLQVGTSDHVSEWPQARIWSELHARLGTAGGWKLVEGPVVEKSITKMRGFVAEPMRYGRLFLAGDAAHIVPPTGAKGLNLALGDVRTLAEALADWFRTRSTTGIDAYSDTCLQRVWRVEHFAHWMTTMLHRAPDDGDGFLLRLQLGQLDQLARSVAASTAFAEQYVGLS